VICSIHTDGDSTKPGNTDIGLGLGIELGIRIGLEIGLGLRLRLGFV